MPRHHLRLVMTILQIGCNKKTAPSKCAGTGVNSSCGATRLGALRPLLCVPSYAGFDNEVPAPSSLLSKIPFRSPSGAHSHFVWSCHPSTKWATLYKARYKGTYTPSSVSTIKAQMSFSVKHFKGKIIINIFYWKYLTKVVGDGKLSKD